MKKMLCLIGLIINSLVLEGCLGSLVQQQAIRTASAEHSCPEDRVTVESEATIGTVYAYWLNICGQRRFYSFVSQNHRFIDSTNNLR